MSPLRLAAIAQLALAVSATRASAAASPVGAYDIVEATVPPPAMPASVLSHDGGWLTVEYPPSAREKIAPLLAEADDVRAELADALGQAVLKKVELRIARGTDELALFAPEAAPPPAGLAAVSYPKLALVLLSLARADGGETELGEAFRHQLAHVALDEATLAHPPPRWFAEGFAVQLAGERTFAGPLTLVGATMRGRLLPLSGLDRALESGADSAPLAAAQACDFVRFLRAKGPARFTALIERLRRGEALPVALEEAYAEPPSSLERAWRDAGTTRYGYAPSLALVVLIGAAAFGISTWRSAKRRRTTPANGELDNEVADDLVDVDPITRRRAARIAAREGRVRIALSRRDERIAKAHIADAEVPKVEHGGRWHTLH